MTRIVLHIERLVLHGIDPMDADAISQALRDELERQLTLSDVAPDLRTAGNRYRVNAGSVHLAQGEDAAALGHAIAARIVQRGMS